MEIMMTVWVTDSWLIDFRPAIRNKKVPTAIIITDFQNTANNDVTSLQIESPKKLLPHIHFPEIKNTAFKKAVSADYNSFLRIVIIRFDFLSAD